MKKALFLILVIACAFTTTAIATDFPSYYPAKGFQNTGKIDALYANEGRIVIDDISYTMSKSAIVHSLTQKNVSIARIRKGVHVGFRTRSGQVIEEFWLLPSNYDASKRR